MRTVSTIGLDIAKSVFQVHGIDAAGEVVMPRQLKRRYVLAFFQKAASLPDRHGGVRLITLLVARAASPWPYRADDAAGLCEAIRQATEERYGRR